MLSDFGLNDWDIRSVGELDKVQEYLAQYGDDVTTIVVDGPIASATKTRNLMNA